MLDETDGSIIRFLVVAVRDRDGRFLGVLEEIVERYSSKCSDVESVDPSRCNI